MASQPRQQQKGRSALLVRQSIALHALDRVVLQERSARVQPGHGGARRGARWRCVFHLSSFSINAILGLHMTF